MHAFRAIPLSIEQSISAVDATSACIWRMADSVLDFRQIPVTASNQPANQKKNFDFSQKIADFPLQADTIRCVHIQYSVTLTA
jgi:hypothetical protein